MGDLLQLGRFGDETVRRKDGQGIVSLQKSGIPIAIITAVD
jgi:3-deoxy-D-manno-octulosonate 8-phosphate phosphatase KdsC-like HAD superfamily phosphatase